MIIKGLKVLQDKGWKSDSTFTSDDGRTMPIPANHKFVCIDECGDVVNCTFVTPAPLNFKVGSSTPDVLLVGNVSHSQFGWTLKGKFNF